MKGEVGPPGDTTLSSGDVTQGPPGRPGPQVITILTSDVFCTVVHFTHVFLMHK